MSRSSFEVVCRYFYDPLDRLVRAGTSQRFYQQEHLVTELDHQEQRSILRHGAQPLAQHKVAGETRLLATDHAHSPLLVLSETLLQQISYTSYGHAPAESGLSRLLGFNGECPERVTGHYLLGQGNRAFNPVLMRMNSPDPLSPFGDGGVNAYAYCAGDPLNFSDPTGNIKVPVIFPNPAFKLFKSMTAEQKHIKAVTARKLRQKLIEKTKSTLYQKDLRVTDTRANITNEILSRKNVYYRRDKEYALIYDDLKQRAPSDFNTYITPTLEKKLNAAKEKVSTLSELQSSGTNKPTALQNAKESVDRVERQIKRHSVKLYFDPFNIRRS